MIYVAVTSSLLNASKHLQTLNTRTEEVLSALTYHPLLDAQTQRWSARVIRVQTGRLANGIVCRLSDNRIEAWRLLLAEDEVGVVGPSC